MRNILCIIILFIQASLLWAQPAVAPQRYYLKVQGRRVSLPVVLTHPLNQRNEKIETVVLVHHGVGRSAVPSYRSIEQAAAMVPHQSDKTFIISPQFFNKETMKGVSLNPTDLYWKSWRGAYGGSSAHPEAIPSYDIIDKILTDAINPEYFPNVKNIVIVGHSMGCQFTIHYGAVNTFEKEVALPRNISMHYVAMNGAHPVYFSNKRFRDFDKRYFEVPRNPKDPGYNNWRLGLENLFPEIKLTPEQIFENFPERRFFYLAGTKDTIPFEGDEAERFLLGRNTYEVHTLHWAHLIEVFGKEIQKNQSFMEVEGIGHDGFAMIKSKEGLKAIFDYDINEKKIWYVDASAPPGGDGTSWNRALNSLDDAIKYAIDGNTIKIAQGTYIPEHPYIYPEGGPDPGNIRNNRFIIGKKITLLGGYAGRDSRNPEKRDLVKNKTVFSGERDNLYMTVLINHNADVVIDGITITKGNADHRFFPNHAGGGLAVYDSKALIRNVIFTQNNGVYGGGAYSCRSEVTYENCLFVENSAIYDGGGVSHKESTVYYRNCTFENNSANYGGGAVVHGKNSTTFSGCSFLNNKALRKGGGISLIYDGAEAVLESCIFMGNEGIRAGGGIVVEEALLNAKNTLFAKNRSERQGAGISLNNNATANISHCTITDNYCEKGTSGLIATGGTKLGLISSIIWNNSSANLQSSRANSAMDQGLILNNCIQFSDHLDLDPTNISLDPQFKRLKSGSEAYRLNFGSPCINAGKKDPDIRKDFENQPRDNNPDIGFDEAG